MAKKSLGYVELEWRCPNCGGRNPGSATVCIHCGAPQPPDVQFEQPAEEKIVKDAEVVKRAAAGPDIHCAYCGTRNPATAEFCKRCGAPLKEGTARAGGAVLGAHRDEPAAQVKCPYCGTLNPPDALKCSNCGALLQKPEPQPAATPRARPAAASSRLGGSAVLWLVGIGVLLLVCVVGFFALVNRTDAITAQVNDVSWQRQVVILGLAPVSRTDWHDEIPAGADLGACREEVRYRSDQPEPGAEEVCGTPHTVDTGSGFGEVVQDCQYLVYDDRCEYTTMEMQPVDTAVLSGANLNPAWPAPQLAAGQELGERSETYVVEFSADGETYTYETRDAAEFARFTPGSRWQLSVNTFNNVVDVEPAE